MFTERRENFNSMTTMFNEGYTVEGIQMDKQMKIKQVKREKKSERANTNGDQKEVVRKGLQVRNI